MPHSVAHIETVKIRCEDTAQDSMHRGLTNQICTGAVPTRLRSVPRNKEFLIQQIAYKTQ